MLVARFSDNIEADIKRNWSAWMSPGCGGTYEDCVNDYAPEGQDWFDFMGGQIGLYSQMDIREFPGSFGCVHHEGLSCYYLDSENVEDALKEVRAHNFSGDGFGYYTKGHVKLVTSVSKKEWRSCRDLHILEVDDCEDEDIVR